MREGLCVRETLRGYFSEKTSKQQMVESEIEHMRGKENMLNCGR